MHGYTSLGNRRMKIDPSEIAIRGIRCAGAEFPVNKMSIVQWPWRQSPGVRLITRLRASCSSARGRKAAASGTQAG
jgi:hypothetical protein